MGINVTSYLSLIKPINLLGTGGFFSKYATHALAVARPWDEPRERSLLSPLVGRGDRNPAALAGKRDPQGTQNSSRIPHLQ